MIKTQLHRLTDSEALKLRIANMLLWQITNTHGTWCECDWCLAREATDTQNADSLEILCEPHEPYTGEEEN